ncbi:MAG: hypothetical protein IH626_12880 [Rhodospirillales bacterium]|nr:hypothetical protein [Rhodospirillales bacterium]
MALCTNPNQHGIKGLKKVLHTIAGSSVQVKNLRAYLIAQGVWDGVTPIDFTLAITGSVWSNDKAVAAITVLAADFPASMKIRINNSGLICGKGDWSPAGGALKVTRPVIIANTGSINGGGYHASGGGGGWTGALCGQDSGDSSCSCCNCICTTTAGSMGYGYGYSYADQPRTIGAAGSGCYSADGCPSSGGGAGGVGGNPGSSGYSVSGNAFITWINTGARNGSIS